MSGKRIEASSQAERERRFFNENVHLLDGREEQSDWNRHQTRRALDTLLEMTTLKGKRVLSAGCGTGQYERLFIERGALSVVGLDISDKNIEIANAKNTCRTVEYRQSNLYEQQFDPDSFDIAVIIDALHHIQHYELVLEKFCRWAREFYCFEPNAMNPVRRINERKYTDCLEMSFYKWSLIRALKEAGYKEAKAANRLFIPRGVPFMKGMRLFDLMCEKVPIVREFSGALAVYASR